MASDGSAGFACSGVVTLTSDFGLQDSYVGVMRGVIATVARGVDVVDLCHGIEPQNVDQAGLVLAHDFAYFPRGTVHVAVVDPGVGSARRILAAVDRGHAFLAPDNGLLTDVLSPAAVVRALDVERFSLPDRSRTFHGRDVFAPAAARLASGLDPHECGPAIADWRRGTRERFRRADDGSIITRVLFADRFGNLVLDLRPADLGGDPAGWVAEARGLRMRVLGTYAEAAGGEPFALVDSYGQLELAVDRGSARERLGLACGDPVTFRSTR